MDIEIQPREEEKDRLERLERPERPELVVPSGEIVRSMVEGGVAKCWYKDVAGNPARLLADGQRLYEGDRAKGMVWHSLPASPAFTMKLETNGATRMNFFVLFYDSWAGSMGMHGTLLTRQNIGMPPDSYGWTACQIGTTSDVKDGKTIGVGGVPLERNCGPGSSPECIDCARVFVGLSLTKQGTLPSDVKFSIPGHSFGYFDSVTPLSDNVLVFRFRSGGGEITQTVMGPYTAVSMSRYKYVDNSTTIAKIKTGLPAADRVRLTIGNNAWSSTVENNVANIVPRRSMALDESHVSAEYATVAPSIDTSTGEFGYYYRLGSMVYTMSKGVSFNTACQSLEPLYCW